MRLYKMPCHEQAQALLTQLQAWQLKGIVQIPQERYQKIWLWSQNRWLTVDVAIDSLLSPNIINQQKVFEEQLLQKQLSHEKLSQITLTQAGLPLELLPWKVITVAANHVIWQVDLPDYCSQSLSWVMWLNPQQDSQSNPALNLRKGVNSIE
ncbi:hypothetical protein PT273_08570 [Orbaceae bacterium ESL0727]|nr:hypothetical protein [Orbaceae bacterium ESL0727]